MTPDDDKNVYTLYGAPGSGSVPIEAALHLIGARLRVIGDAEMRPVAFNPEAARLNPMGQIPVLVLPTGEVMTESAAILIWLADRYPDAGLAPTTSDVQRAASLRWMVYVSSAIYALAWIRNDPMRVLNDPSQSTHVLDSIAERRAMCWRWMDAQVQPGRYLLGDRLSVLDLYVAVVSRWSPRRRRFYEEAPRMAEIVRRVDEEPRLEAFWQARFPFHDGWED